MKPPSLPEKVSNDGREIWGWGHALSEYTQWLHACRELRRDIAMCDPRCGNCDKWMKSSQCPAEKNVNGRNHGPSMNGRACGQYVETAYNTQSRDELKIKLVELESRE